MVFDEQYVITEGTTRFELNNSVLGILMVTKEYFLQILTFLYSILATVKAYWLRYRGFTSLNVVWQLVVKKITGLRGSSPPAESEERRDVSSPERDAIARACPTNIAKTLVEQVLERCRGANVRADNTSAIIVMLDGITRPDDTANPVPSPAVHNLHTQPQVSVLFIFIQQPCYK